MPAAVQNAANDISKSVSAKDLEERIARVRADVADLGKAVASYGSGKADDLKVAGEDALETLKKELADLEGKVATQVRARPLQSLAIAAGAGVLAALLMRR